MKIYVTRHGQVSENAEYLNGDVGLPKGEVPLSEIGREQSTLLGGQLKKMGFSGKIHASPLLRTMETAELVAQVTGSTIVPTPWMHEIFGDQASLDEYQGVPLEELKKRFPHLDENATMEYPWWPTVAESHEDVRQRVVAGIEDLLQKKDTDEEVLLVGHGASTGAANIYLDLKRGGMLWNCCLGLYDTKNPEQNFGKNICFLPGDKVTANKQLAMKMEIDVDVQKPYGIEIPAEFLTAKGKKLLHIGDTHSATYPFYKQLIRIVKPDIIIHTGDTADELKVGWDVSARGLYLERVTELFDFLKNTGSTVYWVPGNNDLPEEVAKIAPFAHIKEPDSVLDIEGTRICVTHSREQITQKADIYLYGHGRRTGESFEEELEASGKECWHLNTMWNVFGVELPQRKMYRIERPD